MKHRIGSFLLALVLLYTFTITVFASNSVPDLSRNGSITFLMDLDDRPLDGGNLNLYKVGDIEVEDGNYSFCLIDELKDSDIVLDNLNDSDTATTLLTAANTMQLSKRTAPIEEGTVVFSNLPVGLYVVWQDAQDVTKGFAPIQPFLISVPQFQNDEYKLDVVANPKVSLKTAPTESTTPSLPKDETLPQTGQLNWPIPVMILSGMVLLMVGGVLCAGRKRTENEK